MTICREKCFFPSDVSNGDDIKIIDKKTFVTADLQLSSSGLCPVYVFTFLNIRCLFVLNVECDSHASVSMKTVHGS